MLWSSKYQFNQKIVANKRIVVPPMASQTASEAGHITQRTLDHYARLSRAQPGILFVEYSFVHATGRSEVNQLSMTAEQSPEGLKELAHVIHKFGSLAGIQLTHSGGKTERHLSGGPLWSPSGVIVPVKERALESPDIMGPGEIDMWLSSFVQAARRGYEAGFDIIEIHAAHGYGFNQWLSPLTNRRLDLYGGDQQGRTRLLRETIRRVKNEFPDLLVSVRLPARDHLAGGLTFDDVSIVVKELKQAGVDLLNVSSGLGGWRRPEGRNGEGYLVDDAAKIKSITSLPVVGVGGIESIEFIENSLRENKIDFAAVGRAILTDPERWAQSMLN